MTEGQNATRRSKGKITRIKDEIKFMLIQRSEDAKNVMVKFVLEQVGMKRVFCRGFVPYVYQILRKSRLENFCGRYERRNFRWI
jgi:hypothetical protein